jgi:antitoxin FitA
MPTIQIKDVPDEVHAVLRRRAATAGQSLQEFLLGRLREETATPTVAELFERIEHRSGGRVSFESAVDAVRADRDER